LGARIFIVAPAGVLVNVVLSCYPASRFRLKTVGWVGFSVPSLIIGLPTSTLKASTVAAAGGVAVGTNGDGSMLAIGAGAGVGGVVGIEDVDPAGGSVLVPLLEVVIDRLIKYVRIMIIINATAAAPKAIPHGVFRIPRRGFCCF